MNKSSVQTSFPVGGPTREIIDSVITGSRSQQEILQQLDAYGIDWNLTEGSDLWVRCWQIGAKDFVLPEHVPTIQGGRSVPEESRALEWVSEHLSELREKYAGSWIAVAGDQVVTASANLPNLLRELGTLGIDRPFITEIPAGPLVWDTAYARLAL